MPIELDTVTAPSAWASYLIYGDASGLEFDSPGESEVVDAWAATLPGQIVDCEDAGFMRYHDAHRFLPLAADCQTYTIHIYTKG